MSDSKASTIPVPETVLKRRAKINKVKEIAAKNRAFRKVARRKARKEMFTRIEKTVASYRAKERETIRMKRLARSNNNLFVEEAPKLAFVVRIRGINRLAPKTRKILHLLRLRQIHNGVFIRLNKATENMLRVVSPYITWGTPTLKTVSDLIYKRGHFREGKERVAITDNAIVEKFLKKYNITCVEDLIHEVFTVGPNFKAANSALWTFKLNSPKGGYIKKRNAYTEGGDFGYRGKAINGFVKKMI